jgi:hypothetical protein
MAAATDRKRNEIAFKRHEALHPRRGKTLSARRFGRR